MSSPPVHVGIKQRSIFPVGPNKRPLADWKRFQESVPTTEDHEKWKGHRGPWAMACGPVSGLVALDFDGPDGEALLSRLKEQDKHVPTWEAKTPSGGVHLFYAYPNGSVSQRIKNDVRITPGLDVRTKGGYVVVPSSYDDGRRWITPPTGIPAPLPGWFIDLLKKAPDKRVPTVNQEGLPPSVGKGQRNNIAASLAGRYLRRGNTPAETLLLLVEWNKGNNPPLPKNELKAVVDSISTKERTRPTGIEVFDSTDLLKMNLKEPEHLIAPFLPVGGKGILAAYGGTGKTLLALNIALSLASERPLFERFGVKKIRTLYVDAESTPTLTRYRLQKIARGMGTMVGGVSVSFPERKLDVSSVKVREDLCRQIERTKAELLVLDSFLCFAFLKSENDNTEVRDFLEKVGEIPKKTGAGILFIDHAGKASAERIKGRIPVTPRGAGAKGDWADVVMILEERFSNAKMLRTLSFRKTRFCAPIHPMTLEMSPSFVFTATGEDEICPVFTVRQVVEDNNPILWGDLCNKLMEQTGCSRTSAYSAIRRCLDMGVVEKKRQGRTTIYTPKVQVDQGVLLPERDEWDA